MTNGIVSAINRNVNVNGRTMNLIQTNAALNSGNSGGPLINSCGQVIGINTTKIGTFTDSAGVEGLGFAIPSAVVKDLVSQILGQGYVSGRPFLGITGERLSVFYQRYYRLPAGLYVTAVAEGSSAADVGDWSPGTSFSALTEPTSAPKMSWTLRCITMLPVTRWTSLSTVPVTPCRPR